MWRVDNNGYTTHLSGGNCAFVKKEIQKLGAFNKKLTITADDVFLAMKIVENNLKIKYNSKMIMYHQPRKDLKSFFRWHYSRGKGTYFFKQQVGSFKKFYKLRFWSTRNMIKQYWNKPHLPVMLFLLVSSFIIQRIGFSVQKYSK